MEEKNQQIHWQNPSMHARKTSHKMLAAHSKSHDFCTSDKVNVTNGNISNRTVLIFC